MAPIQQFHMESHFVTPSAGGLPIASAFGVKTVMNRYKGQVLSGSTPGQHLRSDPPLELLGVR